MKKFSTLILLALLPMIANAAVEIDGIYYNLVEKSKIAEVTSNPNGKYLEDVYIPASFVYGGETYSVTTIGYRAFYECSGLTFVNIPNSVTSIGKEAFWGCSSLTSVTIPNSVTSIGNDAFSGCSGLTSITIPGSVTSIGDGAFCDCSSLTSVTIPESVTSIGDGAFRDCSSLTSVTIPESITAISDYTFYECSCLTSVTIPNSVTTIGEWAFHKCSSLTSITIPESVTSIGRGAFDGCSGLTSINIPENVTFIDGQAFRDCSGLTFVTIPNSVTVINYDTFSGCSSLTSITIPESVTSIGNSAFFGCSSLTSITIPNSVTSFGGYVFDGCSGLTSVTIGNGVTSIGSLAFYYCSNLKSVIIGNSVTSIGYWAFYDCLSLTSVYCLAENVPQTRDSFGFSTIKSATLHVPASALDAYKETYPWSGFGKIIALDGKKCATPTISYTDGKLMFISATEEAECVTVISDADIKTHYGNEISLTATYNITVYATKANYENSDTIHATLCWIDAKPKSEGLDEDAVTEVKALPVLIQTQGGIISVQGAAEGTPIAIYDTSGKMYGSATSEKERTTISTSLQPGTVAVVKIGEKVVKVLVK